MKSILYVCTNKDLFLAKSLTLLSESVVLKKGMPIRNHLIFFLLAVESEAHDYPFILCLLFSDTVQTCPDHIETVF